MNSSEKRRKQLLYQMKKIYSDNRVPPAVHPRYSNAYASLYDEDEENVSGTLGLRILLCILLFTAFVTMDYQEETIANVNSSQIIHAIETNMTQIPISKLSI